jgi:hypothetical protein
MSATVHPFPGAAPAMLAPDLNAINRRLAEIAGCAEPEPVQASDAPIWSIDAVAQRFALSAGERMALIFGAAAELCSETAALVARIGNGPPTLGLAMRICDGLDWAALRADAALRRARLITLIDMPGSGLSERPFRIDDTVLLFLNGCTQIAQPLIAVSQPVSHDSMIATDAALVAAIAACCADHRARPMAMPVMEIRSSDPAEAIAHAIAGLHEAGHGTLIVPLSRLPTDADALCQLRDLWLRDALLHNLALILIDDLPGTAPLDFLVGGWTGPVALISDAPRLHMAPHRLFTITHDRGTQKAVWQMALSQANADVPDDLLCRVAHTFCLSAPAIVDISARHAGAPDALWAAARDAACPRDISFVDRIAPMARAAQLILPADAAATIATIIGAGKAHHRVIGEWGGTETRGLGITALFAGESGTGKTMAAEAIANALDVDLYRVEVSAVVSKYIGETEKNLRRVFAAAESGGGVLLFDEADTLFGKRSDVKDAHDRYANMEVGYLLQLMESFAGITILTTNIEDGLDRAFMRRLRFAVSFPLPSQAEREQIWAGIFPVSTPVGDIDCAALSRLSLTGGNIRNIALGSSLRAAATGDCVGMAHILEAARAELAKLGRPLSDIDQRNWS